MADFRADPRRYKVSLKYLSVPKSKRVLLKKKKKLEHATRTQSQFEKTATRQIKGNVSIKIIKDRNGYKSLKNQESRILH